MPRASRRRRALRAAVGLAVLLALGFAVDMLVLVRARVRADGSAAIGGQAQAVPTAVAEAIGTVSSVQPHEEPRIAEDELRSSRLSPLRRLSKAARPGGSDTWSLAMIGITLALAVCGGIIAAGRRFLPQGAGGGVKVIGRVSLSPKHSVYLLEVGRRRLLVGAGPQGAPALISELDDFAEIEANSPAGVEP
jgi:Flagellar biosynthesis protein, FliO